MTGLLDHITDSYGDLVVTAMEFSSVDVETDFSIATEADFQRLHKPKAASPMARSGFHSMFPFGGSPSSTYADPHLANIIEEKDRYISLLKEKIKSWHQSSKDVASDYIDEFTRHVCSNLGLLKLKLFHLLNVTVDEQEWRECMEECNMQYGAFEAVDISALEQLISQAAAQRKSALSMAPERIETKKSVFYERQVNELNTHLSSFLEEFTLRWKQSRIEHTVLHSAEHFDYKTLLEDEKQLTDHLNKTLNRCGAELTNTEVLFKSMSGEAQSKDDLLKTRATQYYKELMKLREQIYDLQCRVSILSRSNQFMPAMQFTDFLEFPNFSDTLKQSEENTKLKSDVNGIKEERAALQKLLAEANDKIQYLHYENRRLKEEVSLQKGLITDLTTQLDDMRAEERKKNVIKKTADCPSQTEIETSLNFSNLPRNRSALSARSQYSTIQSARSDFYSTYSDDKLVSGSSYRTELSSPTVTSPTLDFPMSSTITLGSDGLDFGKKKPKTKEKKEKPEKDPRPKPAPKREGKRRLSRIATVSVPPEKKVKKPKKRVIVAEPEKEVEGTVPEEAPEEPKATSSGAEGEGTTSEGEPTEEPTEFLGYPGITVTADGQTTGQTLVKNNGGFWKVRAEELEALLEQANTENAAAAERSQSHDVAEALRLRVEQLEGMLKSHREERNENEKQILELREKALGLVQQLDIYREDAQSRVTVIDELQESNTMLSEQITKLKQALHVQGNSQKAARMQTELVKARDQIRESIEMKNRLANRFEVQRLLLEDVRASFIQAHSIQEILLKELESLANELGETKVSLEECEAKVTSLTVVKKQLKEELKATKGAFKDFKAESEKTHERVKELEDKLSKSRHDVKELEKELKAVSVSSLSPARASRDTKVGRKVARSCQTDPSLLAKLLAAVVSGPGGTVAAPRTGPGDVPITPLPMRLRRALLQKE